MQPGINKRPEVAAVVDIKNERLDILHVYFNFFKYNN